MTESPSDRVTPWLCHLVMVLEWWLWSDGSGVMALEWWLWSDELSVMDWQWWVISDGLSVMDCQWWIVSDGLSVMACQWWLANAGLPMMACQCRLASDSLPVTAYVWYAPVWVTDTVNHAEWMICSVQSLWPICSECDWRLESQSWLVCLFVRVFVRVEKSSTITLSRIK